LINKSIIIGEHPYVYATFKEIAFKKKTKNFKLNYNQTVIFYLIFSAIFYAFTQQFLTAMIDLSTRIS
jgi:hypothetical protein